MFDIDSINKKHLQVWQASNSGVKHFRLKLKIPAHILNGFILKYEKKKYKSRTFKK